MKRFFQVLLLVLGLIFVGCKEDPVTKVRFHSHNLKMELNVEKQESKIADTGLMTINKGVNLLVLAPDADINSFTIDGNPVKYELIDLESLASKNPGLGRKIKSLDPQEDGFWCVFKSRMAKKVEFHLEYSGVFKAEVEDVQFSNQNVGREVTATILEKGAYFSPASYFYPQGNDGLMSFAVTADIPAEWESVADGNSISSVIKDGRKIQSWKNPYQNDGLMFMAAPFVVGHTKAGEVDVFCYFFEADTSLFETYLPATARYVQMYSDMIGPYPYERFTVTENFFPTGYGMPAWTLLGQNVLKLPFIVYTSLGHEVLHNWWGNSIYVDYESGNWCEGLTVYGADYHYKLQHSEAAARDYRKDILKQYKSYVTEKNEFPVRDFIARHNAESRTIGYNKTMMVFHMIENMIGEQSFFQAWKDIYANHRGEKVTWEQWIGAFETASGEDLSSVLPEWVDAVGAAQLSVDLLESTYSDGRTKIKLTISQPDTEVYTLKVPVKFYGDEPRQMMVSLNEAEKVIEFSLAGKVTSLEIDPDYNVFRHLYPEEVEPIIAAALGAQEKHFLFDDQGDRGALKAFGDNLVEGDITPETESGTAVALASDESACIFLNPDSLPGDLAQNIEISKDAIIIKGEAYTRNEHTFVLSADQPENNGKLLVVFSRDKKSLPRIGQLVPHYGKYSYLVFKGARNIAKGQWPAEDSPLKIKL